MAPNDNRPDAVPVKDEADLVMFAQVISVSFSDDPLHRYVLMGSESHPGHPKLHTPGFQEENWLATMRSRFEGGGLLLQSYNWAAVAVWLPPGIKKAAPRLPIPEGAVEYLDKFGQIKKQYLGDRLHWYLNLIARAPGRLDKGNYIHTLSRPNNFLMHLSFSGAIRTLIEPYVRKALEEGFPVYLEATSTHARDIYIYFGFRVLEEVRIGEGIINAEGWVEQGGEGVLLWAMAAGL
ncbi:hypothetical protein CMQ_5170 [Grosmannia clavigera kw1407]|uniref:N-acetyltransferase domain-containing protein n=1 Tax=Grosmannia clavigera (strain kw1407 / UAMH 11150) TaxID=655863 RepID=F0XBD5_GROCL|nr:uncharacterized protein CMQ_5170 [Grosmannia clavigera kw1407]EFX04908.1 hypothetical protein CMQ_5170 [Grosmannia clavigera kw1407]